PRRTVSWPAAAAVRACIPCVRAAPPARRDAAWMAIASAFVLIAPMRFGEVSVWTAVIARLRGLCALRDPKGMVYLYELGVALATARVVVRAASPRYRVTVAVLAL